MKATQYITGENFDFVPKKLYPSVPMSGAVQVTREGGEISQDFLGFGVAITGSSCYELSLMDANEREKLLKEIYTEQGLNLSVARLTVGASDYSAEL